MDKMKNWLIENGVEYSQELFGSHYFNNTRFDTVGYSVSFYGVSYGLELDFLKACKRYGFTVYEKGHRFGWCYYWIVKKNDVEMLKMICEYQKKATAECEKEMHESYILHGAGGDTGLNERLRRVMDFWENEYLKAAKQAV